MTTHPEHVDRLRALADALDPALAHSLRALLEADSHAHTCQDLMDRTERAEDLAAEARRQLAVRNRQVEDARAFGYDPRPPLAVPVLAAPPPPPPPARRSS